MRSKAGNRLEQLALSFLPEAFILFLDCSHEAEHRNPAPTLTPALSHLRGFLIAGTPKIPAFIY